MVVIEECGIVVVIPSKIASHSSLRGVKRRSNLRFWRSNRPQGDKIASLHSQGRVATIFIT